MGFQKIVSVGSDGAVVTAVVTPDAAEEIGCENWYGRVLYGCVGVWLNAVDC